VDENKTDAKDSVQSVEDTLQEIRSFAINSGYRQEKVCIFIDNSNLFHWIKTVDGKLNYMRLIDELSNGRMAQTRFYYSEPFGLKIDDDKKQARDRFYGFLEHQLGFTMICLPLKSKNDIDRTTLNLVDWIRSRGVDDDQVCKIANMRPYWLNQISGVEPILQEKGLDCEIVYDMACLRENGNFDTFVLVAGDEDYARTVRKLNQQGMKVELAFFKEGCSSTLRKEANCFVDLSETPNLFNP